MTLNHAWAEMAHDTIYKRPDVDGFGKQKLAAIETRMNTIMRKYLMPAGYEFQKVVHDAERLAAGLELFDRGALEELAKAADNNARFDVLQRFVDYVLPNYDDPAGVYPEIRVGMIEVVKAARATAPVPIQTTFGDMQGHTSDQIESLAAGVLEGLRYANVAETFNATCELYLGAGEAEGRKLWAGLAVKLAKNELHAWKQVGPGIQYELVLRIEEFTPQEWKTLRGLLLPVLREVLDPDVTGTSSTWDTVTLQQGAVTASEFLRQTRTKALGQLKAMFEAVSEPDVQQDIVGTFMQATRTPYNANYSDDLMKIILADSLWVVGYFETIVEQLPFELRQRMEHDLYFLYVRGRGMHQGMAKVVGTDNDALNTAILSFRNKVNADPQFVVYKTLVGYQSIFPKAWERRDFDFQADEDYRNGQIDQFVESIEPENAEAWLSTLKRCAQTESNDLATFPSFGQFLQTLGARKPNILLSYVDDLDDKLGRFLPSMLLGLSEGPRADDGVRLVRAWLKERKQVAAIMRYLRFAKPVDPKLLDEGMAAALETQDDAALLDAVHAANVHHGDVAGGLITKMLMPAIEQLSSRGKTWWVDEMWFLTRQRTLISDLTGDQADAMLAAMVQRPKIEFHAQAILVALGTQWPEKVIDLFERRLKQPKDDDHNYEAVPFQFHEARPVTDESAAALIDRAYGWYQADNDLFSYRGGRLIAVFFPSFSDALAATLIAFVNDDRPDRVEYVLRIMRAYHGESFLQPVCREVVAQLPEDDRLLGEVEVILDSTGVVRGEFGFVEAYQRKKREIEPWLADPNPAVQAFARRYQRTLDRQIAADQRRAEEGRELRKRNWSNPEDEG